MNEVAYEKTIVILNVADTYFGTPRKSYLS